MVTVYRVETPNGDGPYAGQDVYPVGVKVDRHPNLSLEGMEYFRRFRALKDKGVSMRFGFATREQLATWFNARERAKLAKAGFEVATYTLPDDTLERMVVTPRQCVFPRKFAERGEVVPWGDIKTPRRREKKGVQQLDLF